MKIRQNFYGAGGTMKRVREGESIHISVNNGFRSVFESKSNKRNAI